MAAHDPSVRVIKKTKVKTEGQEEGKGESPLKAAKH